MDISITYYFGQIKIGYRGGNALFMNLVPGRQHPSFVLIPLRIMDTMLNHSEIFVYTSSSIHSPIRSYIGVSPDAKHVLERKYDREMGTNHPTYFRRSHGF